MFFILIFIQNVLEDYDDIVVTVGSGGTASGIAIGILMQGSSFIYSVLYVNWIGPLGKSSPHITL